MENNEIIDLKSPICGDVVEFNAHIYPTDAIYNELASLTQRRSGVRAPLRPLGTGIYAGFYLVVG